MKQILFITGGARSGKSGYAEKLALSLSPHPIYLATSRVWDEEFSRRIEHHRQTRGEGWINLEEDKALSKHDVSGKVVLIECVTLWCTNFFFDLESNIQESLKELKKEFDSFTSCDATYIFVSNEIGLGGVSENDLQRRFTDLLGWMNQYIAAQADEVWFMVSGLPMKVK